MFVSIMRAHTKASDQVGVEELYAKAVKANVASYEKKTTRQKYAKQEAYTKFRSSIWVKAFPRRNSCFLETKGLWRRNPNILAHQCPRSRNKFLEVRILYTKPRKPAPSKELSISPQNKGTTAMKTMISKSEVSPKIICAPLRLPCLKTHTHRMYSCLYFLVWRSMEDLLIRNSIGTSAGIPSQLLP